VANGPPMNQLLRVRDQLGHALYVLQKYVGTSSDTAGRPDKESRDDLESAIRAAMRQADFCLIDRGTPYSPIQGDPALVPTHLVKADYRR
jgi:hypothetical protein